MRPRPAIREPERGYRAVQSEGCHTNIRSPILTPVRSYDPTLPIRARVAADGSPHSFVLDGVTYVVETIEEVRAPRLDWWLGPEHEAHRMYYLVTTNRGMVAELVRDEVAGTWGMARRFD